MAVKVIGTHSGDFHADDVTACAILKLHPDYKTAVIERSRDRAVLDNCHIVVDVGGSSATRREGMTITRRIFTSPWKKFLTEKFEAERSSQVPA